MVQDAGSWMMLFQGLDQASLALLRHFGSTSLYCTSQVCLSLATQRILVDMLVLLPTSLSPLAFVAICDRGPAMYPMWLWIVW